MKKSTLLLILFLTFLNTAAQHFETDLQIRPRFEFRNGYKTLLSEDQDAAQFISQRSRLNLNYLHEDLQVRISLQNVHVWGDVPTMRLEESNGVAIFEAYGKYFFNEEFSVRIGRQVLSYDNQRILGEVNWAQQGQSHDAAVFSWMPASGHKLDLALAYNAEAESLFGIPYHINSYKNLQLAWYHLDVNNVGFSFLFMNTGYEFEAAEQEREINYIQTFGAFHNFSSGDLAGDVAVYGQTGDRNRRELSAWYAGLNLNYRFSTHWRAGLGAEYLSGTDMGDVSGENHSFTPLFGTNHGFNGFMDYFFAGNHQNSVGLLDIYGKLTYASGKFELSVIPHAFSSAANVLDNTGIVQDDYLGTEIDLTGIYKLRRDFSIGFGYSQMFGTNTLELLKGGDAGVTQNWAWLMVNFNPTLFSFTREDESHFR